MVRTAHPGYFIPKVETKDCNSMIDGENLFNQPVRTDIRTYNNIWKIAMSQGDNYITGCLIVYPYFKET